MFQIYEKGITCLVLMTSFIDIEKVFSRYIYRTMLWFTDCNASRLEYPWRSLNGIIYDGITLPDIPAFLEQFNTLVTDIAPKEACNNYTARSIDILGIATIVVLFLKCTFSPWAAKQRIDRVRTQES